MDPNALYEIHVDNDGDAREDMTFQFRFKNNFKAIALPIGDRNVADPADPGRARSAIRAPRHSTSTRPTRSTSCAATAAAASARP